MVFEDLVVELGDTVFVLVLVLVFEVGLVTTLEDVLVDIDEGLTVELDFFVEDLDVVFGITVLLKVVGVLIVVVDALTVDGFIVELDATELFDETSADFDVDLELLVLTTGGDTGSFNNPILLQSPLRSV